MKKILKMCFIFIGCMLFTISVNAESQYSEIFQEVVGDGVIEISAIEKDDEDWQIHILDMYFMQNILPYLGKDANWHFDYVNQELQIINNEDEILESQKVSFVFQKPNESALKEITDSKEIFLNEDNEYRYSYTIEDLSIINLFVYNQKQNGTALTDDWFSNSSSYAPKIRDYLSINSNFGAIFYLDMGDEGEISNAGSGSLYLTYNDIIYDIVWFELEVNRIIYIPNTTENTTDAYAKAVSDRLNAYMPNVDFKVSYGGKIADSDKYYNEDYIGQDYYNITINDETFKFIVRTKPLEELTTPTYTGQDEQTGIKIETSTSTLPLNTRVVVNPIEKTTDEYKSIATKLGITNMYVYDISLYSNDYQITKIDNGNVKVTIPLGITGKDIFVYYINEDGVVETLEATIDESGNVSFETNHFSTYIISEEEAVLQETDTPSTDTPSNPQEDINNVENPQTGDNLVYTLIGGFVSVIMIIFSVYLLRKNNKVKNNI